MSAYQAIKKVFGYSKPNPMPIMGADYVRLLNYENPFDSIVHTVTEIRGAWVQCYFWSTAEKPRPTKEKAMKHGICVNSMPIKKFNQDFVLCGELK